MSQDRLLRKLRLGSHPFTTVASADNLFDGVHSSDLPLAVRLNVLDGQVARSAELWHTKVELSLPEM